MQYHMEHPAAIEVFNKCRAAEPQFAAFLQERATKQLPANVALPAKLSLPLHRIHRYPALLRVCGKANEEVVLVLVFCCATLICTP
jgi:hypothetical protein